MHPQLSKRFVTLENDRRMLMAEISASLKDKHHHCIDLEKWSISQILTHLLTSEKLSLSYMKKKFLGMEAIEHTGFFEVLKSYLLKLSQRLPLKYKAPPYVLQHTPPPLPLDELNLHWQAFREELRTFLETFNNITITKKIYKHPIAGRLNIIQALDFFHEHILHHWPQIKRCL